MVTEHVADRHSLRRRVSENGLFAKGREHRARHVDFAIRNLHRTHLTRARSRVSLEFGGGVRATNPREFSDGRVTQVNGKIHVLLINKDPSAAYAVTVSPNGATARGTARVFDYGKDSPSIRTSSKQVRGASFAIRLAPYSITTVQLP